MYRNMEENTSTAQTACAAIPWQSLSSHSSTIAIRKLTLTVGSHELGVREYMTCDVVANPSPDDEGRRDGTHSIHPKIYHKP